MFKKFTVLTLTTLVLNLFLSASVFAETKEDKTLSRAERVKANITKLGTGTDSRIEVKLKDGTKLKGYVSQINETSFVVMTEKNATATEVPYPNAKQIKGNNLSTGVKVAIGVAIFVAIFTIIGIAARD